MDFVIRYKGNMGAGYLAKLSSDSFKLKHLRTWLNHIQDATVLRVIENGKETDRVVARIRLAEPHEKRNKRHKWFRWIAPCNTCRFEFHECHCDGEPDIDYELVPKNSTDDQKFDFMDELESL